MEPAPQAPATGTIATTFGPLAELVFSGAPPIRFEFWDGSALGPARADTAGTVRLRSRDAVRRILWSPDELGLGRAYVVGDADVDGDVIETLRRLRVASPASVIARSRAVGRALRAGIELGVLGAPLPPPAEELRLRGRRHSKRRDSRAVSHHYDVGNDFYRVVLGPSLTYSCARWDDGVTTVADAQAAKHDLVSRKLGLHTRSGARLLDVGCGWGSMAMHAASEYGATVVGITISEQQHDAATRRVKEAGLEDRVEIRLQDYRDLGGESFDAISSIGMFEHVGMTRTAEYFNTLYGLLRPTGRLLNHAITSVGGSRLAPRSFVGRYVFPDGELMDVADTMLTMESIGFEVRDLESLREHYALTLRAWIRALEHRWTDAVREVGESRARIWRIYMAGSVVGFEEGDLSIHQVLGVVPDERGRSGIPLRRDW